MKITTGFVLRQYRELLGIKQWQMAALLGFSPAVLCEIEKGRKELTTEIRDKAQKIFEERRTKHNHSNRFSLNDMVETETWPER